MALVESSILSGFPNIWRLSGSGKRRATILRSAALGSRLRPKLTLAHAVPQRPWTSCFGWSAVSCPLHTHVEVPHGSLFSLEGQALRRPLCRFWHSGDSAAHACQGVQRDIATCPPARRTLGTSKLHLATAHLLLKSKPGSPGRNSRACDCDWKTSRFET